MKEDFFLSGLMPLQDQTCEHAKARTTGHGRAHIDIGEFTQKRRIVIARITERASRTERCDGGATTTCAERVRTPVNNIEYFPPNFEGLVLGCIDADFCK